MVLLGNFAGAASAPVLEVDVCVYGGTSGGVIAAVQVARLGKTAVLLEPGNHLGGMSAGGLSWTDVGSKERVWAVGGMAREFYQRVGKHYGHDPAKVFDAPASDDPARTGYDFAKPPSLSFEPRVAEAVFNEMIREARVPVHLQAPLAAGRREGMRIGEITMKNGLRVRAKVFIDATYEGDLLAAAGVSFTCGREANSQYGETVNGIQGPATNPRAGKFDVPVDPYVIPGQPASGVLPYLLQAEAWGPIGAADRRIQSYNYRVCLTDNPTNRIPIAPPPDYDPAQFELFARWIAAREQAGKKSALRDFLKYDPLQNNKYDFNNRWAISTDFIGGAHEYPTADPVRREQIARAHENYLRGFFHFLASSPGVPASVRDEMSRFGLCRDEFTGTGGWPHQLYVREARRMVSDFVMTEQHCVGERVAPDGIGLGTYGIDMHAVRRVALEGRAANEGTRGRNVPAPYPIGYGAIVPKAAECENLFVTFALSASHVAFGSIRMEPTFMILSHSAATAAVLAIEEQIPVQRLPYSQLAERLKAAGQVLGR
jgi:hypothetical protein